MADTDMNLMGLTPFTPDPGVTPDVVAQLSADREQSVRDAAIRLAIGIGAATAAVLAWGRLELSRLEHYVSERTADVTRQGHITDRYTRAVDQLGSTNEDVRLGGIYALGRLARDSADDSQTIASVLSAYVRNHRTALGDEDLPPLSTASQAALTVLGRPEVGTANLARTDLIGARLANAQLPGADLSGSDLSEADLAGVNFTNAVLAGTNFTSSDLSSARVDGAFVAGASFTDAFLADVDLTEARGFRPD